MAATDPVSRPCPQCGTAVSVQHSYCPTCGFPVGNVAKPNEDKFVGRTLPGGYHILDLISVGGMGRVYRAEQSVLGRTVAVKIIHPHLLSDENSALRFMTEARAASQLNHPNSIAVFDFGRTDDGQPYLVMEFLRGRDLAHVMFEDGPLSFSRIVDVLKQVLAALAEAHHLGIVHRDLKPENVVLEPMRRGGDFVKVLDFGLAKLKQDTAAPNVTSPGIVCGTPDYMSPEQGRGDAIDGRSDLYSLGVVLFQLLTGRLPFEAESPTQVVMMHLTIPVPDPRQVAPQRNIPIPLVEVVYKALAKEPDFRFRDAHEFSEALHNALRFADVGAERLSGPPASASPSLLPGALVNCPGCGSLVPMAKFCLECGERLSQKSSPPERKSLPHLPLPIVGRDEDLAWLETRRQQATLELVGARIVGEPGAGKTRLVREFLDRARSDGDLVVATGPDPYWAEAACFTLRDAVRALAKLSDDEIQSRTFDGASPEATLGLAEIFSSGSKREARRSPLERRHALAEAVRWALEEASSSGRRVILAIDELHRVDASSRAAFADLIGEPPQCAALVLVTHVPGFDTGWSSAHPARVLTGLPPPIVSRLLSRNRPSERLRVMEENTGRGVLPMYVEQLARFASEGGSDAPPRLADLIGRRIDMLDPEARRVLQALAVIGDRVELKTIEQLVPKAPKLAQAVASLESVGMVERRDQLISTSHPLLREVVLNATPAAVRRELHRKALRALEKHSAPIEAQALHAYEAQDSFQALLLLEQVADRASARGDTASEVLALRRGLDLARMELARGELDDPLRAILIFSRKLGAALTRAGNLADAEGVLREALDIAGPSGPDRARVLGALAHVAHGRQREREALGYIEEAITAARQSGAHDLVSSLTDTRNEWASCG
jgi:serine/threonine-protein kinase